MIRLNFREIWDSYFFLRPLLHNILKGADVLSPRKSVEHGIGYNPMACSKTCFAAHCFCSWNPKDLLNFHPPKRILPNPLANRQKPPIISIDREVINCSLNDLLPIELKQVRKSPSEKLFNSLISQYHYLGYSQPIGEHLKYIAYSRQRPIACLGWCSAPWSIGVRDRFIGWPAETRQKNLHLIITNTRFLIPPWVEVYNLASHILAVSRHCVPLDWQEIYKHGVYLMESFIDTEKFIGTCCKADNWICLGETTGRGKLSQSTKPTRSRKAVYCYPLIRNFREVLNQAQRP